MKLVIIRHGDPDYSIDSLTEKGWREAELLSERIAPKRVTEYLCSPLGRARDTASLTLKKAGREARVLDWLREFDGTALDPETGEQRAVVWDLMPSYWTEHSDLYEQFGWQQDEYIRTGDSAEKYKAVCDGLDALLAEHGYTRSGRMYRTDMGNDDVLVLFCHFGVQCVMLSHLIGLAPVPMWHCLCSAPTGVTVLYTEEREKSRVSFRCLTFGDTSHLYVAGEEPAFAGRFCESYERFDQRH